MLDTSDKIIIAIGLSITMTVAVLMICVILLPNEGTQSGTLYFNDSNDPICTGALKTNHHVYSNDTYRFDCDDGRVINQLTNFRLK